MSSRLQGNWLMTQAYSDQCVGGRSTGHAAARRSQTTRAPHFTVSLETLHGLHCAGCEPGFLRDTPVKLSVSARRDRKGLSS